MTESWLAIVVGVLYATGVYLMLRRSVVKLLIGLALLSHAANLLVFSASGVVRGRPPIVEGTGVPLGTADPIPQALVLTAIVIGFGVLAFAITLLHRAHQETGTDDIDHLDASAP
ncbi:MAG TPA: Na+/H+ antiporter subunit C [Anaeromyxobacteraceae bacterium]|nr:Na+/H+ antiporter subunit C [Anaeromyxobacteraceae bacterium]